MSGTPIPRSEDMRPVQRINDPVMVRREPIKPRTRPSYMNLAGVSPAHKDREDTLPPVPNEYAPAAHDAPSDSRAGRREQDEAAEESQDTNEWGEA